MKEHLRAEQDTLFNRQLKKISESSRFLREERFIQHGNTSCLTHSIAVAYYSHRVARRLKFLNYRTDKLIRGALLHDYFLYDWHLPNEAVRLHGFRHPSIALRNAKNDFELDPIEQNIIERHMFPLTPLPPKCKEAFTVCMVDKVCSLYEVFSRKAYRKNKNITALEELAKHSFSNREKQA